MGKRRKTQRQREERRFRVRGERRDPPDMRKLGKALLSLAQAEVERQAQEQHELNPTPKGPGDKSHQQHEGADDA